MGRLLALVGAALVAVVLLPAAGMALLPMPSLELWVIGLLVLEFSLVFAALALAGVVLAVFAGRRSSGAVRGASVGVRRVAAAVGAVNATMLGAALLPAASAWGTARQHGVPLSLAGYLEGLSTAAERGPDETVRYARVAGEDLMLDVWQPAGTTGAGSLPVVVNVHGGAEDAPQSPFPRWDAWLADSGHVVFDVDYRFFQPYDWQSSPGDVKCALGWVARNAERYGADPKRITLMGQSAGGYLSLLAAYTTAAEVPPSCDAPEVELAGVISWFGPGDATAEMPHAFRLSETVRRQLAEEAWPLAEEDWAKASPSSYVRPGLPRTLLIQGGRDVLQPAEHTRSFAARLAQAGVRYELMEIPYADHQFDLVWGGFGSQIARHAILDFQSGL
ncbi:alpha/beta hydrolase fold domain-containing protein [Microtetraspora malaysiensis]|uniref:alpha/beta hydrolase fold domain-containing protein n=1 Tax=Microtetraspora malaysiensis TaxID=161358 RepID=UPI003D8B56F1